MNRAIIFLVTSYLCAYAQQVLADASPDAEQASYTSEPRKDPARAAQARNSQPPRQLAKTKAIPLPLPPPGSSRAIDEPQNKPGNTSAAGSSLLTGLAALAVVLGLFFVAAWALRRAMPAAPGRLPGEVVEVLGRTPLATRQFAHLIRCGNKLLLVHLAPGTAETLTEITDPAEVDRIAGLCKQSHPQSTTATFRQIFQQFAREKP